MYVRRSELAAFEDGIDDEVDERPDLPLSIEQTARQMRMNRAGWNEINQSKLGYEDRFEGLPVAVTGKVIKRDGKITWIQPTNLKVVN